MINEVQWFACICLDSEIVSRERCWKIYNSLEDGDDLLAFGQCFLDEGIVEDIEAVPPTDIDFGQLKAVAVLIGQFGQIGSLGDPQL